MKMYLDDLRTPVEEFDFIVRSYDEAVEIIKKYGVPNFLSFDHDLGIDTNGELLKTGYDLAKWLVYYDQNNQYTFPMNFKYKVHSQNPIGKKNIIILLENYLKRREFIMIKFKKSIEKIESDIADILEDFDEEKRDNVLKEIEELKVLNEKEEKGVYNNEITVLKLRANLSEYKKTRRETKNIIDNVLKEFNDD